MSNRVRHRRSAEHNRIVLERRRSNAAQPHKNKAKAICATCAVIDECLAFALANEDFEPHVYGGMTGDERRIYSQFESVSA